MTSLGAMWNPLGVISRPWGAHRKRKDANAILASFWRCPKGGSVGVGPVYFLLGLTSLVRRGCFWGHPSARTGNLGAAEGTSLTRLGTEKVFAVCFALLGPGTLRARGHRVTYGG